VVEVVDQEGKGAGGGLLERVGLTPLPPYILAARRHQEVEVADEEDRAGYQTVYSRGAGAGDERGSVAAPTAGLHFTPELLARLEAMGVERAAVTLEVGLGTFKPVEAEFVEDHAMHAEWCVVPRETARAISRARGRGGRVIAVGTTSARVLESFASVEEMLERGEAGVSTRILITPGYRFRNVDGLMTNFHLPRSTLMAMVAAFVERDGAGDGVARLRGVYREALERGYRFYSYGDAMIVL
jgi:S-adenosylmethionine:tRNA ribosyltransferase-isomerase